ncbi:MAG: hypothetical protein PWQ87_839 [Candidatus Woesearchaeota archaeon]|nr:hypothetical protein [Candidatus Woesearchaeota archaeon]
MPEDFEKEEFEEEEDINADDLLYEAHLKIDALLELLFKKNIITEDEYDDMYEKLLNEDIKEQEASDEEEDE